MQEKNGHLSDYVAGQETIARVLQEQGERYRRLIRVQEAVATHFLGLTKEVQIATKTARQSKKSNDNGREYLRYVSQPIQTSHTSTYLYIANFFK